MPAPGRTHGVTSVQAAVDWANAGRAAGAAAGSDGGSGVAASASTSASPDSSTAPSAAEAAGWWDPVQVPLPTYLGKAKATRTVRTVELGEPGTWTSGRLPESELLARPEESTTMLLDASEPSAAPAERGDDSGDETDDGEHRRAVGDS